MPVLPDGPRLRDFQRYVSELEQERGFAAEGVLEKCLLLGEEVGELFKAVRRGIGVGVDRSSRAPEAAGELADLLIYLCAIANRLDIDLEEAFLAKEKCNEKRTWG